MRTVAAPAKGMTARLDFTRARNNQAFIGMLELSARRGGLKGSKVLGEKADGGIIQALREANIEKDNGKKKGQNPRQLTEEHETHRPLTGDILHQNAHMEMFLLRQD